MGGTRPAPGTSSGATPDAGNNPAAGKGLEAGDTPAVSTNVYARAGAGMLDAVTRRAKRLVYVPDHTSNRVDVIDPRTYKVVRRFPVPAGPQHVVPSWDLRPSGSTTTPGTS